jgi:hypothetical protein
MRFWFMTLHIGSVARVSTLLALAVAMGACAPRGGGGGGDGDDDDDDNGQGDGGIDPPVCTDPEVELCNNAIDDDCDGMSDCSDAECADAPACSTEGCGELQTPEASLELPDGACPEDETEPCDGYESAISFTGFTAGQELEDITKLVGICLNIEHSWMRDLVIYAQCPSGTRVMLSDFEGHSGGEVYLGVPDDDDGNIPVPGVGWDYCWTPTAANLPWIPYANDNFVGTLPAGDYQSSEPLDAFLGCPLNGDWTLRVEDRWGSDNGFIFSWSVKFDPSIVEDCSTWLE